MYAYFILGCIHFVYGMIDFSQINMYTTISELVLMSRNVYYDIGDQNWLNGSYSGVWDISVSNDTVRAYLFTDSVVGDVIAFKGTSTYWTTSTISDPVVCERKNAFGFYKMSTVENDKYNDNLYYSCCFYKQSGLFHCDTQCSGNLFQNTCCKDCYKKSLDDPNNYLNVITSIIENAYTIVPKSNDIVFTGHSLGGTLASLAAVLYNKTGVSFESPGDLHYARLIGLNINSGRVFQFGHTGDPLFTGHCGNLCSVFGYHVNTKCHVGKVCLYDSKKKLGISESVLNHRVEYVVNNIVPEWSTDFPNCTQETDCTDCKTWTFE